MKISALILDGLKKQDHRTQREFYDLMLPYLRAICSRYLYDKSSVKDVMQESFISIFINISSFNKSKGSLRKWSSTIVINKSINQNKKIVRRQESEFRIEIHDTGVVDSVPKMSDEDLLFILKIMPSELLNVFNLYVIDGYSHQEISDLLNISVILSRKNLSRARQWLQSTFKNDDKTIIYLQNAINNVL